MAGRLRAVNEGLDVAALTLDAFDRVVREAVADFLTNNRRPTVADVADVAELILREAAELTRQGLQELGATPTVKLTQTALTHLSFVRSAARKMISATERQGGKISDRQLRNDFAKLLRGTDVDMSRYGLTRGDVTPIRTVRSDGERLLSDQLFEATQKFALNDLAKRGEQMAHWRLSGRHKQPDICDDLARGGPYLVSKYPRRPHPNCGCFPALVRA